MVKEVGLFQHGKGFIGVQLICLIDIFEDNYNNVHDRFETDSVNAMKIGRLLKRNKGNFSIYYLAQFIRKPRKLPLGTTTLKSFISHTGL